MSGFRHESQAQRSPVWEKYTAYLSGVFDHVEAACPGVQGFCFVDDVAWWAEGKSEVETAEALSRAAMAALDWAALDWRHGTE